MDTERQHRSSEAAAIRRIRDGDTHRATLGAWARSGTLRPRDPSRQASTHKTELSSLPTVPVNPFCPVRQVRSLRRFRARPFRAQRAWRRGRTASVAIAGSLTITKGDFPGRKKCLALYSTDLSDLNGTSRSRRSFTASGPPSGTACLPACISPRRHPWHSRPACVPPRRPSTRAVEMHHRATPSPLPLRRLSRTSERHANGLIRRRHLACYPAFAGRFSNQRSSHSGPVHSYHKYTEPLFTTRSTSCSTRPHFGHSGMSRVAGMRTLAGSMYVVLISLPFNPATFLSPCTGPMASHITPPPARST